jgi:hemolysin III
MSTMTPDTLSLSPSVAPYLTWREDAEERANTITHALGFFLSVPAAVWLIARALQTGDAWHIAGCAIYGATMMGVYLASTLSHIVSQPRWKHRCRQLDQAAIYLFIAGTFTPFAFDYCRDGFWLLIPVAVWAIALWGAFAKLFLEHRINGVEIPVFVFLGWLPVLSVPHVSNVLPLAVLGWMMAGGLCYTVGVWFLKNDHRAWYVHSIWHLLVILGTALHFVAIMGYVAPV